MRDARGTKLFHSGQLDVFRRASSTDCGRALMVVVARTVKEAPDWEPQCGVGMGGVRFDFTLLSFFKEGDVMIDVVLVLNHACGVSSKADESAKSMTRWMPDGYFDKALR